ncbi:MAG: murein biosynthesis integral membrane protein MurJ [Chloroflexota bacterium]
MQRQVALAAVLIMVGNIVSRLLGLVREQVMAWLFGATGATDAFVAASAVPMILYDLLIGGAISAALVPVLVDQTRDEERLSEVVSALLTLSGALLLVVTLVLMLLAPAIMAVLGGGFDAPQREQSVTMVRVMLVAVVFQGLAGVLMAVLYAQQRFASPSFAPALYNGAIILAAVGLHPFLGVESLVAGVVLGAALQLALQLYSVGRLRYRLTLGFDRPEVRTALRLYAPVAAGMVVTIVGIIIDRYLASLLDDGSMTIMSYATRLIQFPLGLVGVALSSAILPTLSSLAGATADDRETGLPNYRQALVSGIRVVFFLMAPALVAIVTLGDPIVELVFQRGQFTDADTGRTVLALLAYAPQLPFTAMDQLLIVAFYARKDTRTPVIVGVGTVLVYLGSALVLLQPLGVVGLALANAIQNTTHGIILLVLMQRTVGGVITRELGMFVLRLVAAACGMASMQVLGRGLLTDASPMSTLLLLGVAGGLVYILLCLALRVREPRMMVSILRRRVDATGNSV